MMLGAASATGIPRCRSIRYFPKVAALAELPRAQVTTTRGGEFLSKAASLGGGRGSVSDWRRTASGASRNSVAISRPLLFLRELTVGCLLTLVQHTCSGQGLVQFLSHRICQRTRRRPWLTHHLSALEFT